MALSDKLTRLQLRSMVRRELLDANGRWWTDAELNQYLDDWQNHIQDELELVWGTSTTTTALSTITLGSDVSRLDAVYLDNVRLSGRTKQNLETLYREWSTWNGGPRAVYQTSPTSFVLWPPLATTGTIVLEYPKKLSFAEDATVMGLPPWTKYSAVPYVCWRAYQRLGPNQDINKALRRKKQFIQSLEEYRSTYSHFFPYRYSTLKMGGKYEADILNPPAIGAVTLDMALTASFTDEVPSGTVDGSNRTFTLSVPPTTVQVFKNGVLQSSSLDYSLVGSTITFTEDATPQTGDTLKAWIFRT